MYSIIGRSYERSLADARHCSYDLRSSASLYSNMGSKLEEITANNATDVLRYFGVVVCKGTTLDLELMAGSRDRESTFLKLTTLHLVTSMEAEESSL